MAVRSTLSSGDRAGRPADLMLPRGAITTRSAAPRHREMWPSSPGSEPVDRPRVDDVRNPGISSFRDPRADGTTIRLHTARPRRYAPPNGPPRTTRRLETEAVRKIREPQARPNPPATGTENVRPRLPARCPPDRIPFRTLCRNFTYRHGFGRKTNSTRHTYGPRNTFASRRLRARPGFAGEGRRKVGAASRKRRRRVKSSARSS